MARSTLRVAALCFYIRVGQAQYYTHLGPSAVGPWPTFNPRMGCVEFKAPNVNPRPAHFKVDMAQSSGVRACVSTDRSSSDSAADLQDRPGNGDPNEYATASGRCPTCFILDTELTSIHLTVENCHTNEFAEKVEKITGLTDFDSYVVFRFTNVGKWAAVVSDNHFVSTAYGRTDITLMPAGMPGASAQCFCRRAFSVSRLECDSIGTPLLRAADDAGTYNLFKDCLRVYASARYGGFMYCGSQRSCPTCFVVESSTEVITMTMDSCSAFRGLDERIFYDGYQDPQSNDPTIRGDANYDQSAAFPQEYPFSFLVKYKYYNVGTYNVLITDGTRTYTLYPEGYGPSVCECVCWGDLLHCDLQRTDGTATFPNNAHVNGQLAVGSSTNTYIMADSGSGSLNVYYEGVKKISLATSESSLHGSWTAENVVQTSDSRKKHSVQPLRQTLLAQFRDAPANVASASDSSPALASTSGNTSAHDDQSAHANESAGMAPLEQEEPASALLNALRPVSYVMKSDPSQVLHYGFLAQDLEAVLPNLVSTSDDAEGMKGVYMHDFIALLVFTAQHQQKITSTLEQNLRAVEENLRAVEAVTETLGTRLSTCEAGLERTSGELREVRREMTGLRDAVRNG